MLLNIHTLVEARAMVRVADRMSGRGTSGGRGRHGGVMPGGMRGEKSGGEYNQGMQGDRNNPFAKSSFKQKFILTTN
jgi:hypothetical protein